MNKDELYRVITSATAEATLAKLYPDFVPKNASLPAMSYTHNSNGRSRVLNGVSHGTWDIWRISISGNNRDECDTIINEINLLDGATSAMFQAVHILSVNDEPANINSKVFMAFVDIKTFDK